MSEGEETISRKRKFEDEGTSSENAKRKLVIEDQIGFLDLADEILMEILIKLDGESLHSLST